MRRTLNQNSQFYRLLGLCSYDDERKRELVARCTGGRTVHSSEMEHEEMQMAIRSLMAARREIFRKYMPVIGVCCRALGWVETIDGRSEINMRSLNGYIAAHYSGHEGDKKKIKSLGTLDADQMLKLIVSLKAVAKAKGIRL